MSNSTNSMDDIGASSSTNHLTSANGFRQRHGAVKGSSREESRDRRRRDGRAKTSRPRRLGDFLGSRWDIVREAHVKEDFRRFGDHCARNQIRTLLIDCLVMTNLFYPALAVWLQKKFPPLHPPSPPSHNTHRIHAQGQSGPSRRVQKEHPLSLLSTPVLDSFFPYPPPLLPRLTWAGWWGRDKGQRGHEGWTVVRVPETDEEPGGGGDEVRIMRLGWADVGDVLDHEVQADARAWAERDHVLLRLVRSTAEGWERDHPSTGASCVRELSPASSSGQETTSTGPCHIISPHSGPDDGDITPLGYLSTSSGHPSANGSETPDTVPIGWRPNAGNIYHSVAALFRVPRSSSMAFEDSWLEVMDEITMDCEGEVFLEAQGPQGGAGDQTGKWLLSYISNSANESSYARSGDLLPHSPSSLQASGQTPGLVLLLYVLLVGILGAQISNAHKVHSQLGLAITGIVQLCCSSVMSFSILVFLGWNGWGSSLQEPTLPTYILPFVVVVVGVENMSTLTKAVFSIPFNFSVPVRIGLGLSKVGTTIALTSLTDLGLLSLVWLCVNLRPVREFCLFAAVVIITDWFMLHTFFLTVLSIDAQRLELADVLATDGGSPTTITAGPRGVPDDQETGGKGWRRILRTRTTKSGSLILLLIAVGVVYYVFEVQQSKVTNTASLYGYNPTTAGAATASAATARASAFVTTATDLLSLSAPEKLWRALNPLGWPFVRVVVPAASIVVLPRAGHHMLPADIRKLSIPTSRLLLPRLKPLFYLFKVVILPQAVTATALYMLLRYLLKDTELLEAQRDRLGRSEIQTQPEEETEQPTGLPKITRSRIFTPDSGPQVQMLPGSHESDIDVIASSFDGQLLVSVGVDNTVCLWRFTNGHAAAGTRELLQAPEIHADDPVVTATISRDMRWVAAGSAAGLVQLWELLDDGPPSPQELQRLPEDRSARITSIAFDDRVVVPDDPFVDNPHPALKPANPPSLLTARSDGAVLSVGIGPDLRTIIPPPGTHSRVFFLPAAGETKGDMRIISASQSVVTLYEKNGWMWSGLDISVDLAPNDRITCVCQSRIGSHDGPADLIALGHRFGLVEIFDTCGTVVAAIGQTPSVGAIRRVDLAGPHSSRCIGCGAANAEGFFVISSTASHVYVDRVLPHGAVFCRCATSRRTASKDSDTSKDSSPAKGSPSKASLVVPPAAGRARSSPHNSPKRSPSLLSPISNGEFPLSSHGSRRLSSMHRDGPDRPPSPRPSPLSAPNGSAGHSEHGWDMEVYPLGAVVLSGGSSGWGVVRDTLIGIRKAGGGIDDSPWQIWAIDLTVPWNGTILQAETANLSWLMRRSLVQPVGDSGVSMRDRRSGRLLSLNGRAPFPSIGESFSIPTHPSLGYVEVHPFVHRGPGSVVAGFGNRLGVISLPEKRAPLEPGQGSGSTWTLARRTAYTQTPPPPRRLSGVTDNTDGVRSANKAI